MTVNSHGYEISYQIQGSGPYLILLHGYGGNPNHWEAVAKQLQEQYTVVRPNFSKLYYDNKANLNLQQLVDIFSDFVAFFVKHNDHQAVYLAANSFGAMLAQGVCILKPEYIRKLILVGPMPSKPLQYIKDPALKHLLKLGVSSKLVFLLLKTKLGKIILPALTEIWHVVAKKDVTAKQTKWTEFSDRKLKLLTLAIVRFYDINKTANWKKWLVHSRFMKSPVLIIWGSLDRIWELGIAERMHYHIPNSELLFIPKAGHLVMLDEPTKTADAILHYLQN